MARYSKLALYIRAEDEELKRSIRDYASEKGLSFSAAVWRLAGIGLSEAERPDTAEA